MHSPIEAPERYVQPYEHLDPNRRVFAGMLSALDEAVGTIVAALKANGNMWANTLTVFSTDNGGPSLSLPVLSLPLSPCTLSRLSLE